MIEASILPWTLPWLLNAPKGDGHPVLLLPGFMVGEDTMEVLEADLRNRGYDVSHWGLGRNTGLQPKHCKALEQNVHLEGKVARWWLPDDIVFVDESPCGATGKVEKKHCVKNSRTTNYLRLKSIR